MCILERQRGLVSGVACLNSEHIDGRSGGEFAAGIADSAVQAITEEVSVTAI